MAGDQVDLDEQGAANALGKWDGHAQPLPDTFAKAAARITAAIGDGSWIGDDEAGQSFKDSFKVDELKQSYSSGGSAAKLVQQPATLGTNVRTAIGTSIASDEQQKAEMDKAAKKAKD